MDDANLNREMKQPGRVPRKVSCIKRHSVHIVACKAAEQRQLVRPDARNKLLGGIGRILETLL